MRYLLTSIIALIFLLLNSPFLFASSSLRCGSDLVNEGYLKIEVLNSCGEPISREIVGEMEYRDDNKKKILYLEEWIYENNGYYYILQFEGSRLVSVESSRMK